MTKRLLILALFVAGFAFTAQAQFQRFKQEVFTDVNVIDSIPYGKNIPFASSSEQTLIFNLYEPVGDTMAQRPVIILIPGGSFLPASLLSFAYGPSPAGTLNDYWLVDAATRLAKMGYVVITPTHRTGWNPSPQASQEVRASTIMQAVFRAQQDHRGLIRFLRRSVDVDGNPYKIDVSKIASGGSSSGAYVSIHADVFDQPSELTLPKFVSATTGDPYIDTTAWDPTNNPDGLDNFEGKTNLTPDQANYSSDFNVVLCYGGAIGDTLLMGGRTPKPAIGMHGMQDPTTPYDTRIVTTAGGSVSIIVVSGSQDYLKALTNKGVQGCFNPFGDSPSPGLKLYPNKAYEPFNYRNPTASNGATPAQIAEAKLYLDTLISFTTARLFACLNLPTINYPTAISDDILSGDLNLYPNPATTSLNVEIAGTAINAVAVTDVSGRIVAQYTGLNDSKFELNTSTLAPGMYILQAETAKGTAVKKFVVK